MKLSLIFKNIFVVYIIAIFSYDRFGLVFCISICSFFTILFLIRKKNDITAIIAATRFPLAVATIFSFFLQFSIMDFFLVESNSMLPTIQSGENILVCKFYASIRFPFFFNKSIKIKNFRLKPKDIIAFYSPEDKQQILVKRLIGLPLDKISLHGNDLVVNNEIHYPLPYPSYKIKTGIIPDEKVYVLGDNLRTSRDSRVWGFVSQNDVLGKVCALW